MKTYGAGILFKSGGKILLVKRADTGEWAVPGGMIEPDETPQDAARREVREELQVTYRGPLRPFTLVDGYITYLADGAPKFRARLDEENDDWGWFSGDNLPRPLHPGLIATLKATPLNEKDVADLIRAGQLTSPQHFINMWLFAIRVTGTGIAFRSVDKQLTFRSPEDYLNEEFLERCAGVPLIWMHPAKQKLDSEEFAERIVGTLSRGWITPDNEVWAIARVYDADAAELMRTNQLSTSPTVTYSTAQNKTVEIDGNDVLVEDEPLLLDHVAVCEAGVWDKLLAPAGVITNELVEGEKMDKNELRDLIRDVLADSQSKADYYISKSPGNGLVRDLADSCGSTRSKADDHISDRRFEREVRDGSEFARAGRDDAVNKDARARANADEEKDMPQDARDRRDERRGEERALRHKSDAGYHQTERDREDERRSMEGRHFADDDRYRQTERDREDERRGEHRAEGKYRQTAKDRRDESRGERNRADSEKYHQTKKDRRDERRGERDRADAEKYHQTSKDRRDEARGERDRSKADYHESEATRRKQHDSMEGRRFSDADYMQDPLDREHERVAMERYWDDRDDAFADKDSDDWKRQSEASRERESRGMKRAKDDDAGWKKQDARDRRDERRGEEHRSHADESFLRREIEDIRSRLPEEISERERDDLSDAQMKADSVFAAQGRRAPVPLPGERCRQYRRRVLMQLQSASPDYRNVDLTTIGDAQMLNIAEKQIFSDAMKAADDIVPNGQLREVRRTDATGRVITTFIGDPAATWAPFKLGKRQIVSIGNTL